MASPAIMAFVGSDTNVVGVTNVAPITDFANNQLYFLKEGSGATDGIRQFLMNVPGDETLNRTRLQIGTFSNIQSGAGGAQALTYNGQLMFVGSSTFNSAILGCVRASDLTFTASFGITSGSLAQSDGTRILFPYSFAPLRWGPAGSFNDFIISCAAVGSAGGGEVCILTVNGVTLVNNYVRNLDEAQGVAGRGAVGSASGTVFILGKSKTYGVPNNTPIGLYVMTQSAILSVATKSGTVTPPQIDAAWTNWAGASGVAYDQTDGNPIILVTTTDAAPANKTYVVKLNAATAAVMWVCPVNFYNDGDRNFGRHNIVNQKMYYLGSGNRLYTINTATGVATNAVISLLSATSQASQVSDDVSGSIFGFGDWIESATHPTYVGTYMGTLAHHSLFSRWWRYFPDGLPVPAVGAGRKWLAEAGPVRI